MASLRWHPRWGERAQELSVLVHDAEPERIEAVLRAALLDDQELAAGESARRHCPDPFGWWHTDPCQDSPAQAALGTRYQEDQP